MKKLLWIGDACCDSGFARTTHQILSTLRYEYEIHVIGVNYRGGPHDYPYNIHPAYVYGCKDLLGYDRISELVPQIEPDVVVLLNDPWNIPRYTDLLKPYGAPIVGIIAVDGLNCAGTLLNDLTSAIFWTKFGLEEAIKGGFKHEGKVIPLGVDLHIYKQEDRVEARKALGFPEELHHVYIVGNANRNQPRKRFDLTVKYFCDWITSMQIDDAYLFIHTAPTGEYGYNCGQLMNYYGVRKRLIRSDPGVWNGMPETELINVYNACNAMITTTQGEGFGLPTLEGMACGVPQILPDWSALGEWASDAAYMIPCSATAATVGTHNPIGGIMDQGDAVHALGELYHNLKERERLAEKGIKLASDPRYRWSNIAARVCDELGRVTAPKSTEIQAI